MPLLGEAPGVVDDGRRHDGNLPPGHVFQAEHVEVADEAAAEQTDANCHGGVPLSLFTNFMGRPCAFPHARPLSPQAGRGEL